MKEIKLEKDKYNNIDVRTLKPDEYMKIKLHKYNKANEKPVIWNGGTFTSYNISCLHNGVEVYLKLTGAVARRLGEIDVGSDVKIMAVENKQLKGGKTYVVFAEEETSPLTSTAGISPINPKYKEAFDTTIRVMKNGGQTLKSFDDENIAITFTQSPFNFPISEVLDIITQFKNYAKQNGC